MTAQTATVETILTEARLTGWVDEIGAYIARQRWAGTHDTRVAAVEVDDAAVLVPADPTIIFTVTRVSFADGRVRSYALPLGVRHLGDALAERAPTFMIATIPDAEGGRILYDALGDPDYIHWLWRAIRQRSTVATAAGSLRCERDRAHSLEDSDAPSVRVLTVEQSNTSVEIGESTFLKHMRRIEPGPSQEMEMARMLEAAGFTHIAPVIADVMYEPGSAASAPLALVQPYLRNSADGWALALTSLRDLYADAEEALAAGGPDPGTVVALQGGAFVAEAARLGTVVAEMHLALAGAGGAAGTAPITAALLNAWADVMTQELDAVLALPAAALEPLRALRDHVRSRFEALRAVEPSGLCTRVHGDLHLGQTLRVDSGWVILDFEGEPDRTPEERRALGSPLRDVAGMLRSFDYAAAVALTDRLMPESADWDGMMAYGDAWAAANRRAFRRAYLDALDGSSLLPAAPTARALLRALETQKAVYELRYEHGHRPTWTAIPLRFLLRSSRDAED